MRDLEAENKEHRMGTRVGAAILEKFLVPALSNVNFRFGDISNSK